MDYNLSTVTRYAVNCEGCDAGTGNHAQQETALKAAEKKGFIAIATPEDGTINLCPECVPPQVAQFFDAAAKTTPADNSETDVAGPDEPGELFEKS
jgi:hypothetical protein